MTLPNVPAPRPEHDPWWEIPVRRLLSIIALLGFGIAGLSAGHAAEQDLFAWKPANRPKCASVLMVLEPPIFIEVHGQPIAPGLYGGIEAIYLSLKGLRDSLPNPAPAELEWLDAELSSWEKARVGRAYKSDVYILRELGRYLNSHIPIDDVRNNQLKAWPDSFPEYPRTNMLIHAAQSMFDPDLSYFLFEAYRRGFLKETSFLDSRLAEFVSKGDDVMVRGHLYRYGQTILCYVEFAIEGDLRSRQ